MVIGVLASMGESERELVKARTAFKRASSRTTVFRYLSNHESPGRLTASPATPWSTLFLRSCPQSVKRPSGKLLNIACPANYYAGHDCTTTAAGRLVSGPVGVGQATVLGRAHWTHFESHAPQHDRPKWLVPVLIVAAVLAIILSSIGGNDTEGDSASTSATTSASVRPTPPANRLCGRQWPLPAQQCGMASSNFRCSPSLAPIRSAMAT